MQLLHYIPKCIHLEWRCLFVFLDICYYKLLGLLSKLLAPLMGNYFPKRPSVAPLHTLSKLYDVSVGFVTLLFSGCVLLYLRSPKGGCCSISDDLSCSPNRLKSTSIADIQHITGRWNFVADLSDTVLQVVGIVKHKRRVCSSPSFVV